VVKIVKDTFRDPAVLLQLVELSDQRKETTVDTTKLRAQLEKIEAKRQRLIDLYTDGAITKGEYQKRADAIEADKRSIEAMLPTQAPALDARRLVKAIAKYFMGFDAKPFEEQRSILRAAFRQFQVRKDTIHAVTLDGGFLGSLDGAKVSSSSISPSSPRFPAPAIAPIPAGIPDSAAASAPRSGGPFPDLPSTARARRGTPPGSVPIRRTPAAPASALLPPPHPPPSSR